MEHDDFDLLKNALLFSGLSDQALKELISHMPKIELQPGDTLFKRGESSDSLYVVTEGLLAAIVYTSSGQKKIAGKIRIGELAGEMGFFSGIKRSAHVEALYHTKVLQLSMAYFKKYFGSSFDEIFQIVRLTLNRIKSTNKTFHENQHNKSIFLFPANKKIHCASFYFILQQQAQKLRYNIHFIRISHIKSIINKEKRLDLYLEKIIANSAFTIFLADIDHDTIFDLVMTHADHLGVIASGEEQPYVSQYIEHKITSNYAKLLEKDLILLYTHSEVPLYSAHWLKEDSFNRIHHVYYENKEEDARFLRLLTGHGIGLILGGGGARGWVQIGVIKALLELHIPIDEIGGVSVGAMIGAIFASTHDYQVIHDKFAQISNSVGNPYQLNNFTWPIVSLLSAKNATHKLQELFAQQLIENLPIHFFCVSCNLSDVEQTVHTTGPVWKWVRASAAVPGLVPPVTDQGKLFVDGGVVNNIPVDVMRKRLGLNGIILTVDVSPVKKSTRHYRFPAIVNWRDALCHKLGITKMKHCVFPSIQNVLMKSLLMGSLEHAKKNAELSDILIQPDLEQYPALSKLTQKQIDEMIDIGYNTTLEMADDIKKLIDKR